MRKLQQTAMAILFVILGTNSWAESRSGTIVMDFDLSSHSIGEEARLWIPYPVSDRYQLITNVKIQGDQSEAGIYTDQVFVQPMLFVRWNKEAKSRKLTFSFAVERKEVVCRDLPAQEALWNPAEHAEYLKSTNLGPTGGAVKKLADEITQGKTTVLDKSRAIYDWVCGNMYRDPTTKGCGSGDVCALIEQRGGKCVDIHSVFVALARAAGVPAREVFGLRLGRKDDEDVTGGYHCWAEFFVPGYGWVPADPGDVRKLMLAENLTMSDAKTIKYRESFWGSVDPYRVKLGMGRDVMLNPAQKGGPLNYFMYPFAQVGDMTLDWMEPETFKYTVTFRSK
ncbi:MAG: transglutaminase-like domain-containing protein [Thermodesulfobacteriota bacterium]